MTDAPTTPTTPTPMTIAIPVFARFTALDGIGPYEVLQRIPGFDITFVGHRREVVRSDNGFLGIEVDATYEEVPSPDIVVFPGGAGTRPLVRDERVLDWVRNAHRTSTFTTSVCTGSLVLAAAGLLDGLTATTHWSAMEYLELLGAVPTHERVVEHLPERIITAAGVSSGIDMALRLVELLVDRTAAEAAQLAIEYDPQPPFDAGSVAKAGEHVMARITEYAALRQ
jgi:transcriptional regulator GlxA family with amidase domain